MIDNGFPYLVTEEDRKKSAPFVYAVAAVSLAVYTAFAIYEVKHQEKIKAKDSHNITSTNNLEKIVK